MHHFRGNSHNIGNKACVLVPNRPAVSEKWKWRDCSKAMLHKAGLSVQRTLFSNSPPSVCNEFIELYACDIAEEAASF
jgi:hypothetical protein